MIVFDENADKIKHEARHRMERAICSKKKKKKNYLQLSNQQATLINE